MLPTPRIPLSVRLFVGQVFSPSNAHHCLIYCGWCVKSVYLVYDTFTQSDKKPWPDKQKDNDNDKYIWDNSKNWESEFMTIIVTWQLRVTLDSIRNSCD